MTGTLKSNDPTQIMSLPMANPDVQPDQLAGEQSKLNVYAAYWQARSGLFNRPAEPAEDGIDVVRSRDP